MVFRRPNKKAQLESILILVSVAIMAIVGFVGMAMLGSAFYQRQPTELMIMADDSFAAEALADMMINNGNLLGFVESGADSSEAGEIKVEPGFPDLEIEHPVYEWCIEVTNLEDGSNVEKCSTDGIDETGYALAQASRHVTMHYGESGSGKLGTFKITLYGRDN